MTKYLCNKIFLVLLISAIAKIFSFFFYGDSTVDKEWGIMLNNLEQHGILSVRFVDGIPVPNIFMPPLYPYFLYSIKLFISDIDLFLNITLIIQLFLSTLSVYLTYKILLKLFSQRLSLAGTIFYAFFPLNIYAVSQISSITLQMFLINIYLLSYINLFNKINFKNIVIFSVASALLILLRGEFFIFVFLSLIYILVSQKINFAKIISISFLILLLISPYLYRNYKISGALTITKSSGYNLLKGNHPLTVVEGVGMFGVVGQIVPEVKSEIDELKSKGPIKEHDLIMDQILMHQAIKFIKENPSKYLELYFKKFVSFLFFDINSTYPNYYSLAHIIPKILLSLSTILGIALIVNFKMNISNYFALFYLANIGLFSFFFILPRYSLSLLTVQLVLSLYGVEKIKERFKLKK
ncbi:glycosyltransferase family 39 protein [Pelagibacteraceae bacterium]|nr:glycosyltransferase family 39 protein [Pelagibacteraceae bacterium]